MLVPGPRACDQQGVPAYLESSIETNIGFYSPHGFEVIGEVTVPDGSVRPWLMWRVPGRPAIRSGRPLMPRDAASGRPGRGEPGSATRASSPGRK